MSLNIFGRLLCAFLFVMPATLFSQILEKIDRGVVASCIDGTHAYVGWRSLLRDEPGQCFNIYRREIGLNTFEKVNDTPVTASTNFVDGTVKTGKGYRYRVKSIRQGKEAEEPGEAYAFVQSANQPYFSIPLKNGQTLKNVAVGDLDGDGAYDFVIQSPAFNVDPYHEPSYWKKSNETYKLEAYSSKGKLMWEYDMGWAIEEGTWYAPYLVYDVDGDGRAEVYTKAGEGDPREMDGHVMEGPEYLVKLDPASGKIIKKTPWLSKEGYESYNYWSRNFLDVAYLDGKKPSLIMQRGTYTIIKTEALDKDLKRIWYWESSGEDKKYRGQGQHGIMTADIDNDGKDEVIPGTFALDDNGKPLWGLGLGHNDVGYIADIDPSRPGLEIFYGIESRAPKNGTCLVEAATGTIIWGFDQKTFHVHSQGMIGDIDPEHPGIECYAGEAKGGFEFFLWSADGKRLSDKKEIMEGDLAPRPLWWDADDLKEVIIKRKLFKYKGDTLQNIAGSIILVADIIGDWREEVIVSLPGELRVYSTNIPAQRRQTCLMQDRQYRMGIADASSGYHYPAQLGLQSKKE